MGSTETKLTPSTALAALASQMPRQLAALAGEPELSDARAIARGSWPVVVTTLAPEPCDHTPPVDGRYVSTCCASYPIGEVHEDAKNGINATGVCGACKDHACFAVECQYCHEIVDALTGQEVG